MMRLVQLIHENEERRVAVVEEPWLRPLAKWRSVHELASEAIGTGREIAQCLTAESLLPPLEYDAVYEGRSPWRLLPPIDHPAEPGRCW